MTLIQLIVNSETQNGAEFQLQQGSNLIGQSEQADVLLLDESLPEQLLSVQVRDSILVVEHAAEGLEIAYDDEFFAPLHSDSTITSAATLRFGDFWHASLQGFPQQETADAHHDSIVSTQDVVQSKIKKSGKQNRIRSAIMSIPLLFAIGFFMSMSATTGSATALNTQLPEIEPAIGKIVDSTSLVSAAEQDLLNGLDNSIVTRMTVVKNSDSISIDGTLSRHEIKKVETAIAQIAQDYGSHLDISAKLEISPEQKLLDELAIRQISFGSISFVVLGDGTRLFVGSEHNGFQVVSIDQSGVVLKAGSTYKLTL